MVDLVSVVSVWLNSLFAEHFPPLFCVRIIDLLLVQCLSTPAATSPDQREEPEAAGCLGLYPNNACLVLAPLFGLIKLAKTDLEHCVTSDNL